MNFRTIAKRDIPMLVRVMVETRGSIARATAPGVLRALCRDACDHHPPPCLVIVLAAEERGIAGYVVAEIGGAEYWKAFAKRHPLAAAKILWKRAIKRFKRSRQATSPAPPPAASPASDRKWQDPGLHIARVQQIAVHPEFRGRGVGTRLYEQLFAVVRPLGVSRVDANIDADNAASVALHHRSGWRVVELPDHFFATIDL
ncbi:MAG: GNAT family N-acetyltransferase [Blastocatellia bacterium]